MIAGHNTSEHIETIGDACPVCRGIVKGNDKYLFYCESCNLLFRRIQLKTSR